MGRKFGAIRARTQEFEALARFLRDRVREADLTIGDLEAATGLKKSAISERLAGLKLDDEAFVDAVVVACTGTPALMPRRERMRRDGRRLLGIARTRSTAVLDLTGQPERVRNVAMVAQELALTAQAKLLDLHEQLDRKNGEVAALARVQQESQLALRDADALTSVLSTWVVVLADEVDRLSRDRELAMTARPPDLAGLGRADAELARTIAQHGRTAAELARAEHDRRLATALLAETLTRTRRLRDEVRQLRTAAQLPPDAGAMGGAAEGGTVFPDGTATAHAFGDDIDRALDRAETIGREIADRLHHALTALDEGAQTLPLSADSATDFADNGVTSTDTADNAPREDVLWWDMLAHVPTDAFVWAEETATALVGERDAHASDFARLVRERPVREILLLADRMRERQWEEGAARLRVSLTLALPLEELTALILALLEADSLLRRNEQGAQLLRAALAQRPVDDVLALHDALSRMDDPPQVVRDALAAIAQRPYADVVALARKHIEGPTVRRDRSALLTAVVRKWPPERVVDLVMELVDIDDGAIVWQVFFALPTSPARQTELLVRLWAALPSHEYFHEMLPVTYPRDGGVRPLAATIAALHVEWPPLLDRAADELRREVMPLIIRQTPVGDLDHLSKRLSERGLSPERIFAPYADLLVPDFVVPLADD
ncbi:hypothetical protein [Streptomyces sp. TLI_185]|uniref:hypothetical protein n=1 Tax=Streptomyces sp. TLI_185 TaxID=2485151 RepID=UPI000F4D38AF|nr:hypothetical protein [Streptomyces sp. TLI_185]